MNDFLTFRKMITPMLIQVLFWLGVFGAVVSGLLAMANNAFLYGLLVLVIGPIVVRVYAELMILFFRINDTLTDIKNQGAMKSQDSV